MQFSLNHLIKDGELAVFVFYATDSSFHFQLYSARLVLWRTDAGGETLLKIMGWAGYDEGYKRTFDAF